MELAPDITSEDLKVFIEEAEEQLQLLDDDILRLEREGASDELLQEIFRAAHTIKGSAATLGHEPMAAVGHAAETLLDRLRNGELAASTEIVNALLHSLDALRAFKDQLAGESVDDPDVDTVVAELEAAGGGEKGSEESQTDSGPAPLTLEHDAVAAVVSAEANGRSVAKVTVELADDCPWLAVRAFQVLAEVVQAGDLIASSPTSEEIDAEKVDRLMELVIVSDAEADIEALLGAVEDVKSVTVEPFTAVTGDGNDGDGAAAAVAVSDSDEQANASGAGRGQRGGQTVRIDVERLDNLANLIGELVIDRTRVAQIGRVLETRYKDDELVESLGETASHISKVVTELQEDVMKARMLPVGTVFRRFGRMVRDLALDMGKQVEFITEGEDTEIDRTVIERINDPLVHLLRNAIDHGIETPAERRAAGKPEAATLTLSAYHEQGHIAISVRDDGRGIDAEKLKASVVAKGLKSQEAVARMSEAEAVNLIFTPGLSTSEKTTEVSGRGVGMDIVRNNIEAINGSITVNTAPGEGTELVLRLPLTLATVNSLLVKVGDRHYALPLVYVTETVKISQHTITTVGGKKELLTIRDRVVPLIRLNDVWPGGSGDGVDREDAFAVIVSAGNKPVALGVDSLTEPQEIVVKSLGEFVGNVRGITGASILGDGRVVLIVDVASLVNSASSSSDKSGWKESTEVEERGANETPSDPGAEAEEILQDAA